MSAKPCWQKVRISSSLPIAEGEPFDRTAADLLEDIARYDFHLARYSGLNHEAACVPVCHGTFGSFMRN
jgi:hypothetical protein